MVYGKEAEGNGGYVACILVNGAPLHERADGVVEMQFETEYQIRLRNKTDKDVVAKVYVDDELVTPRGIIINKRGSWPNQDVVDLDCNIGTKRKFKFVAVDSFDAIDHGKNRPSDPSMGVIKVEFYPERNKPPVVEHHYPRPIYLRYGPQKQYLNNYNTCSGGAVKGIHLEDTAPTNTMMSFGGSESLTCSAGNMSREMGAMPELEAGATVDGGHSGQQFTTGWVDVDWSKPPTIVRVVLKGYWQDEVPVASVQAPQTHARHCAKCGAKRKRPSAKFCEICGNKV